MEDSSENKKGKVAAKKQLSGDKLVEWEEQIPAAPFRVPDLFGYGTHRIPTRDVDVKAVLRIAVLYNKPTACNRATADTLIPYVCLKCFG